MKRLTASQYNPAMLKGKQVAFLGGGNMSEAVIAGLVQAGSAKPEQLIATDIVAARRDHLKNRFNIRMTDDNREAASFAQIIVLSVEPQVLDHVLSEIQPAVPSPCLIISVAAGYPLSRIASHLRSAHGIVRAMPNTPSSVRAGITALAFSEGVSPDEMEVARDIFESVGKVVVVEERLLDAVTGLSGSGPAYVYMIIEALADGGVKVGLPRHVAELLAAQTVLGAAHMLIESGEHPARLKDRVASPGGTTIAGIHQLEEGKLRATLMSAVEAATMRCSELGKKQDV
ncbi:MAG: pyrroline-5-carboxylate reductase [Nitrospiraceae bacterium]